MPINDVLFQRLRIAQRPDLLLLLGDLKLNRERFNAKPNDEIIETISATLRSVGGHSLVNPIRERHELSYKQILVDVADKLAPGRMNWSQFRVSGSESEVEIEDYIAHCLESRTKDLLASMSHGNKQELQARLEADMRSKGVPESVVQATITGVSTGAFAGVAIGPLIASLLFSGLWTSIFGLTAAQMLVGGVAVGGPVGIGLAGIAVVCGPSYGKTIPAVYRLILVRKSAEARGAV